MASKPNAKKGSKAAAANSDASKSKPVDVVSNDAPAATTEIKDTKPAKSEDKPKAKAAAKASKAKPSEPAPEADAEQPAAKPASKPAAKGKSKSKASNADESAPVEAAVPEEPKPAAKKGKSKGKASNADESTPPAEEPKPVEAKQPKEKPAAKGGKGKKGKVSNADESAPPAEEPTPQPEATTTKGGKGSRSNSNADQPKQGKAGSRKTSNADETTNKKSSRSTSNADEVEAKKGGSKPGSRKGSDADAPQKKKGGKGKGSRSNSNVDEESSPVTEDSPAPAVSSVKEEADEDGDIEKDGKQPDSPDSDNSDPDEDDGKDEPEVSLFDGGIVKKMLRKGEGRRPPAGAEVTVHYVGTLLDGTKFDSSRDRSSPFVFKIGKGEVIKGWDKGVALMRPGELAVLTCKAEYAYGASGSPPTIPPNATLQFEVELISFTDKKKVSDDGLVQKQILKPGKGSNRPNDFSVVTVKYKGSVDDVVFVEVKEPVTIKLHMDALVEGLELGIMDMLAEERSIFTVAPEYGYGRDGDKALGVPGDATLTYDVTLVSFVQGEETWRMSNAQKLERMAAYKDLGNTLFKTGKMIRANKFYEKALDLFKYDKNIAGEEKATLDKLQVLCYSNQAAYKLKRQLFRETVELCNKALEIDRAHVKSLYRKGQAHAYLKETEDAFTTLMLAKEVDPANVEIDKLLTVVKNRKKAEKEREQRLFGGFFNRVSLTNEKDFAAPAAAPKQPEVESDDDEPPAASSAPAPEDASENKGDSGHGHAHGDGGDDHGHSHAHGDGGHGHSHGAGGHGHSHGGDEEDHGHSHAGGDDHGHSHAGGDDHGHSHAGGDDHGHSHGDEEEDHGHSHAGGGDHGHSHGSHSHGAGGGHGHSHGGDEDDHDHAHSHGGHGGHGGHGHSHGDDDHGHSHAGGHGHSHGDDAEAEPEPAAEPVPEPESKKSKKKASKPAAKAEEAKPATKASPEKGGKKKGKK